MADAAAPIATDNADDAFIFITQPTACHNTNSIQVCQSSRTTFKQIQRHDHCSEHATKRGCILYHFYLVKSPCLSIYSQEYLLL